MASWNVTDAIAVQSNAHTRLQAAIAAGKQFHYGPSVTCQIGTAESFNAACHGAYYGNLIWDATGTVVARKTRKGIVRV